MKEATKKALQKVVEELFRAVAEILIGVILLIIGKNI